MKKTQKYLKKSKIKERSTKLRKKKKIGGMSRIDKENAIYADVYDPMKWYYMPRTRDSSFFSAEKGIRQNPIQGVSALIKEGKPLNGNRESSICQDRYLIDFDYSEELPRRHLFAIFNGYDTFGSEFAEVGKQELPSIFRKQQNNLKNDKQNVFNKVFSELNNVWYTRIISKLFMVNTSCATCTIVVIEVNEDNTTNFYCAWKGDSRATYAVKNDQGEIENVVDFSTDHTLDNLPDKKLTHILNTPCTCQPDNPYVKSYSNNNVGYIILASHGIWGVMENSEEAYKFLKEKKYPSGTLNNFADNLLEYSEKKWKEKKEVIKQDDISLIVIKIDDFLQVESQIETIIRKNIKAEVQQLEQALKDKEEKIVNESAMELKKNVDTKKIPFKKSVVNSDEKDKYGFAVYNYVNYVTYNYNKNNLRLYLLNLGLDPNYKILEETYNVDKFSSISIRYNIDPYICQRKVNALCNFKTVNIIIRLFFNQLYIIIETDSKKAFPIERLKLSKESFLDKIFVVKKIECYVFRVLVEEKVVFSFKIDKEKFENDSHRLSVFKKYFDDRFPKEYFYDGLGDKLEPVILDDVKVKNALFPKNAENQIGEPGSAEDIATGVAVVPATEDSAAPPTPPAVSPAEAPKAELLGGKNQNVTGNKKSRRLLKSFQKKSSIKKIKKFRN